MSRPIIAVFLGGPWHLHQVAMPDMPRYYEVPIFKSEATGPWLPKHYPDSFVSYAAARYVSMRLPDPARGGDYYVYVFEGTR